MTAEPTKRAPQRADAAEHNHQQAGDRLRQRHVRIKMPTKSVRLTSSARTLPRKEVDELFVG